MHLYRHLYKYIHIIIGIKAGIPTYTHTHTNNVYTMIIPSLWIREFYCKTLRTHKFNTNIQLSDELSETKTTKKSIK